jgi:hypothetical protein
MPTIALEGTGAKIAFGKLFEADLLNLTLPDRAKDAMRTTHLANRITTTSTQTKLIHPGQVVVEFDQVPGNPPLLKRPPEKITISYPKRPDRLTPDQLIFTAFATSEGNAEFTTANRITRKVVLTVTGDFGYVQGTPPKTSERISPILERLTDNGDGTWTSLWGYYSRNSVPITIPIGDDNRFHPQPISRGQPNVFLPGRQYGIFEIVIRSTLVWILKGPDRRRRTATASIAQSSK